MRAGNPLMTLLAMTAATSVIGCGGGSSSGSTASGATAGVGSGSSPSAVTSSTAATPTTTTTVPPPPPATGVAITPQGLSVRGRTRLLYGGEVQYFRIRDRNRDAAVTHRMWEQTLDQLVAAGMNLVTCYVPWDVHEPSEGTFDFSGINDLPRFLEMCHARDLAVVFKPGPFINAEWPYGLGTFGAIPEWFKVKYPGSLARKPDGSPFTVDLLGGPRGRQPSFFSPELRAHTERFFQRLAPIIQRFVHQQPTIMSIQIDNETNFYFADRYASDYSSHGLAQYRAFLRARYGTVAALNGLYGTSYADFDQVQPPTRAPDRSAATLENLRHQDWFDAGQAGIEEYHLTLRGMWERLGVREPDVLFCTNDSPHTFPSPLNRDLAMWHGGVKNKAGVAMLDAYPRQLPTSGDRPLDMPFLTSFFSKRFATSNDGYAFAGGPPVAAGKCYGAELEGGLFGIPLLNVPLPVPVTTTDQVLLQHIGRGSALAAVYVFRAGLNRDDSPYFSQAAVAIDGATQPRYEVLRRWGRVVRTRGDELLASVEVECDIAVAVDSRFDAPAGGVAGRPAKAQVDEAAGAFGWLEDAGLNPAVVDLRDLAPGDLSRYELVVFANPDVVHEDAARLLDDYVRQGGDLVNILHTGKHDQRWRRGTVTESLLGRGLFGDGQHSGTFEDTLVAGSNMNLRAPAGPSGPLAVGPFLHKHTLTGGAAPVAWDRTFPFGADGPVVAWTAARGAGQVTHFGTNPGHVFTSGGYYGVGAAELLLGRDLARWLATRARARGPVVSVRDAAGTAWARRVPNDGAFVFAASRISAPTTLAVSLHDLAALGLDPARTYVVEEVLTGMRFGPRSGADLQRSGLAVPVGPYGAAVLRVE